MSESEAQASLKARFNEAVNQKSGTRVFAAASAWCGEVYDHNRLGTNATRPMLDSLHKAIIKVLEDAGLPSEVQNCFYVRPPGQHPDGKPIREALILSSEKATLIAKLACRNPTKRPNDLPKHVLGLLDWILARFAPRDMMSRWPEYFFIIVNQKFAKEIPLPHNSLLRRYADT